MLFEAAEPTLVAVDWILVLVNWMTIVTGVIAVGLFLVSVPVIARGLTRGRLESAKRRTVGAALRAVPLSIAPPRNRLAVRREIAARATSRFAGLRATPADEINWLSAVLGLPFAVSYVDDDGRRWLSSLAEAYEKLAARLAVRGLLGSGQPILEAEATLAHEVFEILHGHAQRARTARALTETMPHKVEAGRGDISYFGMAPGVASIPHGLLISWRRRRLVVERSESDEALDSDGTEYIELPDVSGISSNREALMKTAHAYDGILPAMHSARLEKDSRTGHARLHLSITESSYSAHLGIRDLREKAGATLPRIVTLSLLPVTSDDRVVLVRRSSHNHSYGGEWAPGVNGNLDIPDQRRKHSDADESGRPDPIAAILREGVEELGLEIPRPAVAVHGLAQIRSEHDNGSWVLAHSAQLRQSFSELVDGTRYADPVEGRWELGGELCGIPVPQSPVEAEQVLRWAHSEPDVTPHLAITLAFYLDSLGLIAASEWDWNGAPNGRLPRGSAVRPVVLR